jgi:hypothetical protein
LTDNLAHQSAKAEQLAGIRYAFPVIISTSDARSLPDITASSVDYIFTDPPYGNNVQYGELNFVWEAWLDLDTHWHSDEIIVNEVRGKSEADWAEMMRGAMAECLRVLKPGRCLSLCYHDTSEGTWTLIQDVMAEVGFVGEHGVIALYIDTNQKSFNQINADKVTKRDLVINFRKPRLGEVVGITDIGFAPGFGNFTEAVRALACDYLTIHPGSTKDRVYDEVVSRLVRAGQMEPHDFDALLAQVAEPIHEPVKRSLFENRQPDLFGAHEIVRWYLKETETAVVDTAESAKEDAAAATIGAFIKERLAKNPGETGIHYSDIFEQYVYIVKDKPRRQLVVWLLDYFFKTEAGTYRLPASEEEAHAKVEGRVQGTSRRVRRYLAFLEQAVTIPEKERPSDSTLAEWIRHCKRAGLYAQGKLLFEKGGLNLGNLSEEDQVNVEEDYGVCVRALAREAAGEKGKRSKGTPDRLPALG